MRPAQFSFTTPAWIICQASIALEKPPCLWMCMFCVEMRWYTAIYSNWAIECVYFKRHTIIISFFVVIFITLFLLFPIGISPLVLKPKYFYQFYSCRFSDKGYTFARALLLLLVLSVYPFAILVHFINFASRILTLTSSPTCWASFYIFFAQNNHEQNTQV